ncbi:ABC transporter ATP-binding protein [Acrocarpospora catenulata]|uniref:ABC transporter ATP-binding protein n=1 Tax=Acrocarpospora catenulata TaxID=2836182 RepID=UPI001BDA63B2|nr:ABC transporter ATP-binding protein [Acrocarpospora catenulata]
MGDLEVRDLTVTYDDHVAVQGVNLDLPSGEARVLLGPNGAGKSTVLGAIAGRQRPREGSIQYGGHDLVRTRKHEIARVGVVLCPQEREVFGALSVRENLELGGYIHRRRPPGSGGTGIADIVEIFPKLGVLMDRPGYSLSGGEQQMVAIGRALMARPEVLLLDEPSAGLAPIVVSGIFDVLRDIAESKQLSILIAEQNVPKAFGITSYAYVLSNGRVHHEGPTAELADDPAIATAYLGGYGGAA